MASPYKGTGKAAGTRDTRVDRPEEGLPGVASVENPNANPPTRATFDAGIAGYRSATGLVKGGGRERPVANIDTTQTSGLAPDQDIKRGQPSAW